MKWINSNFGNSKSELKWNLFKIQKGAGGLSIIQSRYKVRELLQSNKQNKAFLKTLASHLEGHKKEIIKVDNVLKVTRISR